MLRRLTATKSRGIAGVPGHAVAYAAKAPVARRDQRLEHRPRAIAERQVGMADDAVAQPCLAVFAARAHRRDAIDEFHFAYRLHRCGTAGAIHRTRFDEHRSDDVVA